MMKKKKKTRGGDKPSQRVSLQSIEEIHTLEQLEHFFSLFSPAEAGKAVVQDLSLLSETCDQVGQIFKRVDHLCDMLKKEVENSTDSKDVVNLLWHILHFFEIIRSAFLFLSPSSDKVVQTHGKGRPSKQDGIGSPGYEVLLNFIRDHLTKLEDDSFRSSCHQLFEFLFQTSALTYLNSGEDYAFFLLSKINRAQGEPLTKDLICLMKLRDVLIHIDFEHPRTHPLRKELLECCRRPKLYTCDVGQRFLSFTLGSLHPQLTADIVEIFRHLIPTLKSSSRTLTSVGNILQTSWKLSEGPVRLVLETALEEMVELAILCENKIATLFREVILCFHNTKSDAGTMDFVCRAFPPILFRYMPVACWKVRLNATALYCILFPLVDVTLPLAEYQADLERQYLTLVKLMEDCHPEVRRVAVQGVCRILSSYWEMVPSEKITILLNSLLNEAVRDKSSPLVRAAVLDGLISILNNPVSHATLNALLPKLADFVHDISSHVRLSMAKLLRRMTKIKDFRDVTSVVSVEDIFLRLVKDYALSRSEEIFFFSTKGHERWRSEGSTNPKDLMDTVASGTFKAFRSDCKQTATLLAELMFPSVFPLGDLPKQVERILLMADQYPLALLAVVHLASHRLNKLDCARIGVALLSVASRKYREALHCRKDHKKTVNHDTPKKHDIITGVLLRTSRFLFVQALQGLEMGETNRDPEALSLSGVCSPKGVKRSNRRTHHTVKKTSVEENSSEAFNTQLRSFFFQHLNAELISPFLEGSSFVKSEILQIVLCIAEYSVKDGDDVKSLDDTASLLSCLPHVEKFLHEDLVKTCESFHGSRNLDAIPFMVLPTCSDVFLDLLPTSMHCQTLYKRVLKEFCFDPLSVLSDYLRHGQEKSDSPREPPLNLHLAMTLVLFNKLLWLVCSTVQSNGFYVMVMYSDLVLVGECFISKTNVKGNWITKILNMMCAVDSWMDFLGQSSARPCQSDWPSILLDIPPLLEVIMKLCLGRFLHQEPLASQFDKLLSHSLDTFLLWLTQCNHCSSTPDSFRFLLCDTLRVMILPVVLWIILYRSQKGRQNTTVPKVMTGSTSFHFHSLAPFLSLYLQLSRNVVLPTEDPCRLIHWDSLYHYAASSFQMVSRVVLLILDRMVGLEPVQAIELLEPMFVELPSESLIEGLWVTFYNHPSIHRLCRLASHSMEIHLTRIETRLSSDVQNSCQFEGGVDQGKEVQRKQGVLSLLKRFEKEILQQYTEDSILGDPQDTLVVLLPGDGALENDFHTPQINHREDENDS